MVGFNSCHSLGWALSLCMGFASGDALAHVWKVTDPSGSVHFTNEPPGGNAQLIIQSDAVTEAQTTQAANAGAGNARSTAGEMDKSPRYQAVRESLQLAAQAYGVDHNLLKSVVAAESAFDPTAVSHKGAVGLMQVMPETARRYGVQAEPGLSIARKLTNPELNIRTGTRYLADLLRQFNGQTELAVAAYNAGEQSVVRAGNRVPNFKETQLYVSKVMTLYRALHTRAG